MKLNHQLRVIDALKHKKALLKDEIIEMGRLLMLVQQHEPPAAFDAVLSQCNIKPELAQRLIGQAKKMNPIAEFNADAEACEHWFSLMEARA